MQRQLATRSSGIRPWRVGDLERAIAGTGAKQHGVITRTQLLELGLGAGAIAYRLKTGRLHLLHRGVYFVGAGPITAPARALAAVLACGTSAFASHRTAAALWHLPVRASSNQPVDVTVVGGGSRSRPGIRVHRVRRLDRSEVTTRDRVRVTTPARTLLDLAPVLGANELERACADALARPLTSERHLLHLLAHHPTQPGTPQLRRLLEDGSPAFTRSEAEARFLALIRQADLPHPAANVRLGPYEVDFLWREQRLVVEIDGFAFHRSRASFEADRRRDAELQARGYRVIRVTWRRLVDAPASVVATVAAALARSR